MYSAKFWSLWPYSVCDSSIYFCFPIYIRNNARISTIGTVCFIQEYNDTHWVVSICLVPIKFYIHANDSLFTSRFELPSSNSLHHYTNRQWIRYHAHTKPHFALSVALGVAGPVLLLLSPLREKYLYANHEPIPQVYPLPTRQRDASLSGYDD